MSFGVHQFIHSTGRASYFVERPFGNILVFSDDIEQVDHDFVKAKGGLFRQYFESPEGVNSLNRQLFRIYGAKAVGCWSQEAFDHAIVLERFGIDFSDPSIKFKTQGEAKYLVISQKSKKMAVMGSSFDLKATGEIMVLGHEQTDNILTKLKNDSVDIVFFSSFEKENSLVFKEPSQFQKLKNFLVNLFG